MQFLPLPDTRSFRQRMPVVSTKRYSESPSGSSGVGGGPPSASCAHNVLMLPGRFPRSAATWFYSSNTYFKIIAWLILTEGRCSRRVLRGMPFFLFFGISLLVLQLIGLLIYQRSKFDDWINLLICIIFYWWINHHNNHQQADFWSFSIQQVLTFLHIFINLG